MTAEAINLLAVLAAPHLYARWYAGAPPAELRAALDARLTALATFCASAKGSPDADRFREAAPKVRALAESVNRAHPESLPEPSWTPQARECLAALGFEAPPGGWETFKGWP